MARSAPTLILGAMPSEIRVIQAALRGRRSASYAGFPYDTGTIAGRRVAFIGNDADDTTSGARGWLRRFPVSFPSFSDPHGKIALTLSRYYALDTPVTYLYTAAGVQYSHVGVYLSEQSLRREIRPRLGV